MDSGHNRMKSEVERNFCFFVNTVTQLCYYFFTIISLFVYKKLSSNLLVSRQQIFFLQVKLVHFLNLKTIRKHLKEKQKI